MHDTATPRTEVESISNRHARREQFKRTIAILAELSPVASRWTSRRPPQCGVEPAARGRVDWRGAAMTSKTKTGDLPPDDHRLPSPEQLDAMRDAMCAAIEDARAKPEIVQIFIRSNQISADATARSRRKRNSTSHYVF